MLQGIKNLIAKTAESFGYYVGILPPTADAVEHHVVLLCDKLGVDCLIDVGAHYGEYAKRMRKAGFKGRIVSFEPVTENFVQLEQNSASDDNWIVHHAALGDAPGKLEMNVTVGTEGASFLKPSEYGKEQFGKKLDIKETEEVEVKTIDSVFDDCVAGIDSPTVYLKVDAQGYDMRVFDGAKNSMQRIGGLQTEMSVRQIYEEMPDYKTCIDILGKEGFVLSGIFPVRVDHSMRLIEMDCIMVRDKQ